MIGKLKKILIGKPPVKMNHEFFGKISFVGGDIPDEDDYWEAELEIKEMKKPITVLIKTGKEGPTSKHVAFYKKCVSDLDTLFDKCWPIFEPDFQQWSGKPFSGKWRDDFELMSIEIPKEADENNEWTACYYVEAANHYFTACFIDGKPKYNEIDG
jgi:hypothetical protein